MCGIALHAEFEEDGSSASSSCATCASIKSIIDFLLQNGEPEAVAEGLRDEFNAAGDNDDGEGVVVGARPTSTPNPPSDNSSIIEETTEETKVVPCCEKQSIDAASNSAFLDELAARIARRGPDGSFRYHLDFRQADETEKATLSASSRSSTSISSSSTSRLARIEFLASVLAVQGPLEDSESGSAATVSNSDNRSDDHVKVTQQPIVLPLGFDQHSGSSSSTQLLLWNGEVFGVASLLNDTNETGAAVPRRLLSRGSDFRATNDGLLLAQDLLEQCPDASSAAQLLSSVNGPFALIAFRPAQRLLFIARSRFGQRSLLVRRTDDVGSGPCRHSLTVASVPAGVRARVGSGNRQGVRWSEIPPGVLYAINLAQPSRSQVFSLLHSPPIVEQAILSEPVLIKASYGERTSTVLGFKDSSALFLAALRQAVWERVSDLPPVAPIATLTGSSTQLPRLAVLFSGGIDSAMLAALANMTGALGASEPIDLLNVAFHRPLPASAKSAPPSQYPDRETGLVALDVLRKSFPERIWRFVAVNVTEEMLSTHVDDIFRCVYPRDSLMDMTIGAALWFAARGDGLLLCDECTKIDSDGPDVKQTLTRAVTNSLRVSKGEDAACGCIDYHSPAKILLTGAGADEQLGGYGRHRTAHRRGGTCTLNEELCKDVGRIWLRNMGRDDRLLSDHGKEARFPFLAPSTVSCLSSMHLDDICDFQQAPGAGDKKVLRDAARAIGLGVVASNAKRAIQFGTRSNKMFTPGRATNGVKGDEGWVPLLCHKLGE